MADRFDLDAIEADDALLDLLAAGGESARTAGDHDPAVALLADLRLAVEVEDELPVETIDDPESFLARCAALNPITDPFARKVATRGLAFGVAAVAALSVSGVAAAVTGDPLSPYEKVIEKMVDAVRPQTSFPKEELDGLPIVDRSTIVKVGKDFKEKAKAQRAAENGKDGSAGDDPQAQEIKGTPEVVVPPGDKPVAAREWGYPLPTDKQKTMDPVKPTTTEVTPEPTDTTTTKPADPETSEPTDTTTTEVPPDTPPDTPPSTPTDQPTDTPTPTPTDTTTPPTVDNGTGDSTGDNNTSTGEPTATPTSTPSAGSGEGQSSDGDTSGSDSTTTPGGDTGGAGGSDTSGSDTSGSDSSGDGDTPSSEITQVPAEVKELVDAVESIVSPVLPTPSGDPVTNQTAERFFGVPDATAKSITTSKATAKKATPKKAAAKSTGKHAGGNVSTGSVRKTYPKGKHSSGAYPEGKHAAIARTYGSTTDASLLQILDVVNKPIR
ncbi:hypothetical protein [Kribbella sindirgiensis]|uniref:Uncharacterized protein n=1 Tax=Kribbella sindirgiensis TaxID=1124744 RepID=A0A4R0IVP5_9ACTN|nr:hypothetical protein [Kribbella sindirgiensis]TCC36910.1 hypothetical protein E0H50_09475 [Kribbella sindirgiensis]